MNNDEGEFIEVFCEFDVIKDYSIGWHKLAVDGFGNRWNIATRGIELYNNELYIGTHNVNFTKICEAILSLCIDLIDETIYSASEYNSFASTFVQTNGWDDWGVEINVTQQEFENYTNDTIQQIKNNASAIASANNMGVSTYNLIEVFENLNNSGYITDNQSFIANFLLFGFFLGKILCRLGIDEGLAITNLLTRMSDGCALWKYNSTSDSWTELVGNHTGSADYPAGFGNYTNCAIADMEVFNGDLYVGTWNSPNNGCQIYRYNGSDWEQVIGPDAVSTYGTSNSGGFNDHHNMGISCFKIFTNRSGITHLYAGTINLDWSTSSGCCQLWRTTDGENWSRVVNRGFRDDGAGDDSVNVYLWSLEEFEGYLYAGTFNVPIGNDIGGQLFRSDTGNVLDWDKITLPNGSSPMEDFMDGFGEPEDNYGIRNMVNWSGYLYIGTGTNAFAPNTPEPEAIEIWRFNGTNNSFDAWECIVGDDSDKIGYWRDGFGDYYNKYAWSMTIADNKLWIGTSSVQYYYALIYAESDGCEVWCYNGTNLAPIVEDENGEIQNGFINACEVKNGGARSMIEFPVNSKKIVVGTMRVNSYVWKYLPEKGCQIWIREGGAITFQ